VLEGWAIGRVRRASGQPLFLVRRRHVDGEVRIEPAHVGLQRSGVRQEVSLAFALVALAACDRATSVARSGPDAQPQGAALVVQGAALVVDDATVPSCTVSYQCGLSHPRLGSSSRTTSVDMSTCTRTTSSESRAYERTPPPPSQKDASSRSSSSTKLSTADCARIRAALTAVSQADARAAQESAQVDTEACSVSLDCKGDAAPRLDVQRQTITGPSRVEELIRAVLGVAP
jgi:hypothetical protein